jgi:peptidoglycan/LPS O-acetylase OafA/YrhL
VVGVRLFHGGLPTLRAGGLLGGDAFVVLSGYLITALLLDERTRTGGIATLAFWGRRARRLLPALLALLVVVVVAVGRSTLGAGELRGLRGNALSALLYVANWRMIAHGPDYFGQTAAPSLLQAADPRVRNAGGHPVGAAERRGFPG